MNSTGKASSLRTRPQIFARQIRQIADLAEDMRSRHQFPEPADKSAKEVENLDREVLRPLKIENPPFID